MRYSVRLNDQAAADLADIVLFIARDNPAAAEKLGLALNGDLTFEQRHHLERLLDLCGESRQTWLGWLRQAIVRS